MFPVRVRGEGTHGWQKVLKGLRRDEGEVHEAEDPGERVLDGVPDAVPRAADHLLLAAVGAEDAVLRHLPLGGREEAGVLGPVGQQCVGAEGDEEGRDALDEEEPLPGVHVGGAVHRGQDPGREEARDDVGDGVAGVPDGHARGVLVLVVPRRGHLEVRQRHQHMGEGFSEYAY